ncbi:MAG: Holliday junction resolvase RuvX [Fluviibacter sp.]
MPESTVMGFDFGTVRIGVAIGETITGLAHPLTMIASEPVAQRFEQIAALMTEWQPHQIIVGLPTSLDGAEHEMTKRCRRFGNQLHGRFNLPVTWVDERLSSAEAEQRLQQAGQNARHAKANVDAVAAQILLQQWLDQQTQQKPCLPGGVNA